MSERGSRHPLRMLTVRGRLSLGLGIAVVVIAIFAGQRDVMRIGLLLIALPVLALIFIAAARLRLSAQRSVVPERGQLGSPMIGKIVLSLESRLPVGLVMLEDPVPPELGTRPRFTIDRAGLGWERELEYPLLGRVRGRWECGPLIVRTSDPFGLVQRTQQFTATSEVLVTPQIVPLTSVSGSGGASSSGESQPHRIGMIGADDVLIREYRHGDDVRRVHWRSTARRGDLMVRREEQAWDPAARIILDSRAGAHAGAGMNSSLEWAVSAAASIGLRFIDDGFRTELYEADGPMHLESIGGMNRRATGDLVISRLTDLHPRRTVSLRYALDAAAADSSGQLVVAIMGQMTSDDAHLLLRVRRQHSRGLAILLDVDSFADPESEDARERPAAAARGSAQQPGGRSNDRVGRGSDLGATAALLAADGWQVVRVGHGMTVAAAWATLAGTTGRAGSTPPQPAESAESDHATVAGG
ncbi:DUF58 domain-containing protein [Microlunatus soli]|uniref:Uncharacterized conserved protein, DUF58 family, contains vWF domain n=1 Tax=Microlunatus soli TaxID=630515 RepID=A0A1H1PFZ2_9ACTN|nr:DUF58 domain-containing protein [Microlunatus soli]SDS10201.1 Uncharacterized conserved protein, DUF58 family, contains vWF domain [Microlunatus soli]